MMNTVFSHYRYSTRTCSYCLLLIPTLCFAICVIWAGRDVAGWVGVIAVCTMHTRLQLKTIIAARRWLQSDNGFDDILSHQAVYYVQVIF